MAISPDNVRRRILIAIVSDDQLLNTLVLKGGNALSMVHEVGQRASLDMDFSIATNFPDLAEAKERVFRALRGAFSEIAYAIFDETFVPKPSQPGANQPEWWGGYFVEFKLIEESLHEKYKGNLFELRKRAAVLGPSQKRKYSIDISKNEYCASKVKREIDDYTIYVYSLEMIAIEKLRAICQQMPEYTITRNKTPRARDFYDIHQIAQQADVDLATAENRELFRHIFAAKGVPLSLLGEIHHHKAFHAPDWPAVETSISVSHEPFDYYFDYVVQLIASFNAWWVE